MSILNQLASARDGRSEEPNIKLAKKLAQAKDRSGIKEIGDNLSNEDKKIQADCIKVLYEIGYIDPSLVADYVDDFLNFLESKNNRLVWGAMIGLLVIASLKPDEIFEKVGVVINAIDQGSVITKDAGVDVLAQVAAKDKKYAERIVPYLIQHLETCRPKDIPQHSEKMAVCFSKENKDKFKTGLEKRFDALSPTQAKRVKKVLEKVEQL